jgi:glycosyltransferase involved in cell wall biosynthesis
MKILWVNPNFLHPTTKGGQIRTLEIVKRLHQRHEIHYAGFADPAQPEGPQRAGEYSTKAYSFRHSAAPKTSLRFAGQVAGGLFSRLPLAVSRWVSPELRDFVSAQMATGTFDRAVCDFLAPAPHFADLRRVVLFQHNVETMIWRRHAETATSALRRAYFQMQAEKMFAYEKEVCRSAGAIIAVSGKDRDTMQELFGVDTVRDTPTGVDIDFFAPQESPRSADLVFVGSMDWMPNIDGVRWFVSEILPLLRRTHPDCDLAVAGRSPGPQIEALGKADPRIRITGTVPDIRPWLWGAQVSVVPLRVGGGTRLKIYESMAAGVPVVSTTVGAEGLEYTDGETLLIADTPEQFATACARLLTDRELARRIATNARALVASRFSWDRVVSDFEELLAAAPACR